MVKVPSPKIGDLKKDDVVENLTSANLCLQLWMESEESAVRSCPLCQLAFPTGYPDDALIKHIDSHLENSKI